MQDDEMHWRTAEINARLMSWRDGCSAQYAQAANHYRKLADEARDRKTLINNPRVGSLEQGGISDRLANFDDWGNRIRARD